MTGRILIFAVTLLGLSHGGVQAQVSDSERQALIDLYHQTGGEQWSSNQGWLGPRGTECDWSGVVCHPFGGVGVLSLNGRGLVGPLPDAIFHLPWLREARLSGNELTGPLPDHAAVASWLSLLDLSFNDIDGTLPASWSAFSELTNVNLSHNQLQGGIPVPWQAMPKLERLYLTFNQMDGDFWPAFNISTLKTVDLSHNQYTVLPEIPATPSAWRQSLRLNNNLLSGTVPDSFGRLSLSSIDVSGNQLEGPINNLLDALYSGSDSSVSLKISDNHFVDPIPASISDYNFGSGSSDLCGNRFAFSDPSLLGILDGIQRGGNPQLCNIPTPADITLTVSGTWFVPERSGEGYSLMATDDGSLLAFWFGYPQSSMPGDQHWQMGQTELAPGQINLPEMMLHRHGHFALGAESMLGSWRNVHEFTGLADGDLALFTTLQHLWWNGILPSPPPPPFYDRQRFKRLSQLAGTTCQNQQPHQWISGVWYDPARVGEGFVVEVLEDGIGLVYWFTYTPGDEQEPGMQAWMTGMGQFNGTTLTIDDLMQPVGGGFRPDFQPENVQRTHWGSLTLRFDDADDGRVDFSSVFEDYGSGGYPIVRLARPLLADCT